MTINTSKAEIGKGRDHQGRLRDTNIADGTSKIPNRCLQGNYMDGQRSQARDETLLLKADVSWIVDLQEDPES